MTAALRWQFLQLAGPSALPDGLRAGRVDLTFQLPPNSPAMPLPAGLLFLPRGASTSQPPLEAVASDDPGTAPLRLRHDLVVHPLSIKAVQTSDGRGTLRDVTRLRRGETSFPAWGDDPIDPDSVAPATYPPALFLGLDRFPDPGKPLCLRIDLDRPGPPRDERARLTEALIAAARRDAESVPGPRKIADPTGAPPTSSDLWDGIPADPLTDTLPEGDDPPVVVAWEYFDGVRWSSLIADDPTRGLTLDGTVTLTFPSGTTGGFVSPRRLGQVQVAYQYLRCRLVSGRPDVSPPIARIEVNTVEVEQVMPAFETHPAAVVGPCGPNMVEGTNYEDVPIDELAWRLLSALDGRRSFPGPTGFCGDDRTRSDVVVTFGPTPADQRLGPTRVRVWSPDKNRGGRSPARLVDAGEPADDGSRVVTPSPTRPVVPGSAAAGPRSSRARPDAQGRQTWRLRAWPDLRAGFRSRRRRPSACYTFDPASRAT